MKTKEFIERYGAEAYEKQLEQIKTWRVANPEKMKQHDAEKSCKGGKYYDKHLIYMTTGIPGEKCRVRGLHNRIYVKFKRIIDPHGLSQIHHEYLNDGTANYTGVALVEKHQHQHGYIDVIHILEGKITLFTEKGVRKQC